MNNKTRSLINHRLDRPVESLEEAKILFDQGYTNTYVNRLYYACFYAVSALLLTTGHSSAKHSGIRSFFHQKFVKTGLIMKELGQVYDKLYDSRQKSDYADFVRFDPNEVSEWYDEAKNFVKNIKTITLKEMERE